MVRVAPVLILLAAAYATQNGKDNTNGDQSVNLYNLGRVGSKFYFVGREDATGNWTSARKYCQDNNMTLASIDTEEELSFLSRSYLYGVFHGWHWTAARDVRTLQQFVWDDSGKNITISIPLVSIGLPAGQYATCGTFYIDPDMSGMSFHECSQTNGFTLCEGE